MAGKGYVNIENSQMVFIDAIFTSKYHINQLNPRKNKWHMHAGQVVEELCYDIKYMQHMEMQAD